MNTKITYIPICNVDSYVVVVGILYLYFYYYYWLYMSMCYYEKLLKLNHFCIKIL